MIFRLLGDHDAIDEQARDPDLTGVQRRAIRDPLDLNDDDAAGVVHGHRDRERVERQGLLLHRDVAVDVGGRAADDGDIDVEALVEEIFFAADLDELDEVLLRNAVDLPPAQARIDERAESDGRHEPRFACGRVAEELGDHALGQVVRFDLVLDREPLELRRETPVPADRALDEALVCDVVDAALFHVALTGGIDQRQVARLSEARRALALAFEEALLERNGDVLCEADPEEPGDGDRVSVDDQTDGLGGRDDLVASRRLRAAGHGE